MALPGLLTVPSNGSIDASRQPMEIDDGTDNLEPAGQGGSEPPHRAPAHGDRIGSARVGCPISTLVVGARDRPSAGRHAPPPGGYATSRQRPPLDRHIRQG